MRSLPEAMRVLLDPAETGAVTLSLPQDVQAEAYDFPAAMFERRTWRVSRRPPAAAELNAAVEALRAARRPLVIAGGGVHYSDALPELAELSERLGIPVDGDIGRQGRAARWRARAGRDGRDRHARGQRARRARPTWSCASAPG